MKFIKIKVYHGYIKGKTQKTSYANNGEERFWIERASTNEENLGAV